MADSDAQHFINRELSWLAFNQRVLGEANKEALPLFERLKFLGIVSSNLDEFFMVRVAGLKQQIMGGVAEAPADGMLPSEQYAAISERAHVQVDEQYRVFREAILPQLAAAGIALVTPDKLTEAQRAAARTYFSDAVFPTLTPLAVDPGHPFPHLRNKSLNVAVLLRKERRRRRTRASASVPTSSLAVVQVPAVLERLVRVPSDSGQVLLLLEDLISAHVGDLFPGYVVEQTAAFRVLRNWDFSVDESESDDLLETIEEELRRRDRGAAVRLEISANASEQLEESLTNALRLGRARID